MATTDSDTDQKTSEVRETQQRKPLEKRGKHIHSVGNDKMGGYDRKKGWKNRSICHSRRDNIAYVNIRREKQAKQGKQENICDLSHNIVVVMLHKMEKDEGEKNKRMRQVRRG